MRFFITSAFIFFACAVHGQRLNQNSFQRVNTTADELNPVISPDGKSQYITIANHPDNIGGKKDPGDIWVSILTEDNQWSAPIHGGAVLNDQGFNGVAGFSADGRQMFLLSHYSASGNTSRTQGIAVSKSNSNGWSKPENISIPYFQNKSSVLNGYVLPDLSAFVFSAETYGTRGVEDIYVCVKSSDGSWSQPKNLGGTINTKFQELSPSLTDDGKTLYFSSNGRKGAGSFDVYAANRLDDSWTNWSAPENLGASINTEGRELYYRPYERAGFALYTSTKNSDGYGDIKIFLSGEPIIKDTIPNPPDTIKIVAIERAPDADKRVKIYGKVNNAKTGEPIIANIYFTAPSVSESSRADSENGYHVLVPSTEEYTVKIEALGYISTLEKLDIQTYEMKDLEMNFKLQPVEIGTTVNLKDVLFEQGKTNLLPQSYPELDLVISFLGANPKVKIELSGHTDNRGIPAQNVKLSQARVEKVKSYLVSKGVDAKRVSGKGYGGSKPIASNDTEDTRLFNRRVEFTIKKL